MHLNIFQNIIDIIRGKRPILGYGFEVEYMHRNYKKILKNLKLKIKKNEKIRVCFSVVYDSNFPARAVFEKMLQDEIFEPFILVIPDKSRGEKNMFYQMKKTYKSLSSQYDKVYQSYDYNKKEFIDWSNKADMVFFANPYDAMTDKKYSIKRLSKYSLTLHVPYSYSGHIKYSTNVYKSIEYSYLWKIYVENHNTYELMQDYNKYSLDNLDTVGYTKMDNMTKLKDVKKPERPMLIIAPHHTVRRIKGYLNLSNFMRFYDFYLELPKKYPNIDFIFRPHPILFITLSEHGLWSREKVDEYIKKINDIPNMEYQEGGDYFETFQKSSGLINDCSSFLPEYFYFNKPQCFVLENKEELEEEFTQIGRNFLKHVYNAYEKEDIINFIDNVVIKGIDTMKNERMAFAQKNIILNHPCVSDKIIENLKKELRKQ